MDRWLPNWRDTREAESATCETREMDLLVRIRCTEPVLPERVIGRHRRAHEAKYRGDVGGAHRGMDSERAVGGRVCGG